MTDTIVNPTILIVDDEAIMIRLLDDLLESSYDLQFAMNGADALALLDCSSPDLILLDVELPDMSGYDVCRAIRNNPATHEIPVIFLTSNDRQSDLRSGFEAGGMDYVNKPVNIADLMTRIETHILRSPSSLATVQENIEKED